MEYLDCCFFCTSTFQLMPIISLTLSLNMKGDLYIDPQFKDAELLAKKMYNTGLFQHVIIIPHDEIYNKLFKSKRPGLYNHLEIVKSYLHVKQISQMIIRPNVIYKYMFLSTRAYLPRVVQLNFIKRKYPTEVLLFEDGTGSYYDFMAGKPRKLDSLVRLILFGKKSLNLSGQGYLFCPEIFLKMNPDSAYKINSIERIWEKDYGKKVINAVFSGYRTRSFPEKAIIIDTVKEEVFSAEEVKSLYDIYRLITKKLGKKNVIIKRHPRDTSYENKNLNYYDYPEIPFEHICMETDMSKKIIISYFSTAAVTPKMLFDQEPFVIMLYRLIGSNRGKKDNFGLLFETVKKAYKDPHCFFIPKSIKELEKGLEIISSKILEL